jgi:alpha-tubulin suppressor-like RCC1 family protein
MKFIYTFGLNEDGQCGHPLRKEKVLFPTLIKISPHIEIVSISAGSRHTLALTAQGTVYSWGWGHVGQLGHADFVSLHSPKRIESLYNITTISAGGMHSACIDKNHHCYTWGSNTYGQLGIGRSSDSYVRHKKVMNYNELSEPARSSPQLLQFHHGDDIPPSPYQFAKVACGGMHTAAIDLEGKLYCWGKADNGQVGFSTWYLDFTPLVHSPRVVSQFPGRAKDISCGGFYTLVLTERGQVYAMGKEDFGCLGTISDPNAMSIGTERPTLLTELNSKMTYIRAAGWHSCFLSTDGELFVCGKGEYGRLGLGDEVSKMTPTLLATDVQTVSGGGSHTIFSDSNNQIFCAGRLDGGRCGVGLFSGDRLKAPKNITDNFMPGFSVVQVEAGGSHSVVLVEYPEVKREEDIPVFFAQFDTFKSARSAAGGSST